jgi:hypothetical protein
MTIDLSERKASIKRQFRGRLNLDEMSFVLGDTDGTINNPNFPGKIWIQAYAAGGLLGHRSVYGPTRQIPMVPGMPIKLKYDRKGRLQIDEIDQDAQLTTGVSPAALIAQQSSPASSQTDIQTLAVIPSSPPDMNVSVRSWNPVIGNTVYLFPGAAAISLSAPSAGDMYYACLFVKADFSSTEVKYSTARAITAYPPLGLSDIQECLNAKSPGSTPVYAVKLIGGQTTISLADLRNDGAPLQQLINTDDGVYRGTVQTTDATVTTLYTFTIPASTTFAISASVVARRTGGASGTAEDGAFYERVAAIKNVAGTATIIGSVATPITIEDQAGWDCTIDVTGATARVRITGAASNNVSWIGTFKVYQVST